MADVESLVAKLKEIDPNLSWEAAEERATPVVEELVKRGGGAVPHLLELLKDDDFFLCSWGAVYAIEALGKIKDERAFPVIIKAALYGGDALGEAALHALQRIGRPAAPMVMKAIEEELKNPTKAPDGEEAFLGYLIGSLEHVDGEDVFQFLIHLLEVDDKWVVSGTIATLAERGDPRAIPYIEKVLQRFGPARRWPMFSPERSVCVEAEGAIHDLRKLEQKIPRW